MGNNSEFTGNYSQRKTTDDLSECNFSDNDICGCSDSCKVYDIRLNGIRVAVKRLKHVFLSHPVYLASYKKEFNVGVRLKHPGLPVYRDFKEGVEDVYIVMEYIDGVTLDRFIKSEAGLTYFSRYDNVKRFLTQLLDVVAYLHRVGVIHCDIKASNIMIRNSDYGIMLLDLDKSYCDSLDLTHGGTYEASEPLVNGERPTIKKDITAIGKIIDGLSEKILGFPQRRLKKFRRRCDENGTTCDALVKILEKGDNKGISIWGAAAIILLICSVLYLFVVWSKKQVDNNEEEVVAVQEIDDTIATSSIADKEIMAKAESTTSEHNVNSTPVLTREEGQNLSNIEIDYDSRMSKSIKRIAEVKNKIHSSALTPMEVLELMESLSDKFREESDEALEYYKKKYSGHKETDIAMAFSNAAVKSKANRMLEELTKEVVDSLSHR